MKTVSIYDNINHKFEDGLKDMMQNEGVKRVDFCVGYFNLRGWDRIIDYVDRLAGDYVDEGEDGEDREFRTCRLLIGMNRPYVDIVRETYGKGKGRIDNEKVIKYKRLIAQEFRNQLLIGNQTKQNEQTLRRLSKQLKDKKVCVKLYLGGNLHAKLYIAYRPNDTLVPQTAIMGSSNLTFPGLNDQGELNAPFTDGNDTELLVNWFEDRWNDKFCIDITDDLIDAIDNSWASTRVIPPYYIYLNPTLTSYFA